MPVVFVAVGRPWLEECFSGWSTVEYDCSVKLNESWIAQSGIMCGVCESEPHGYYRDSDMWWELPLGQLYSCMKELENSVMCLEYSFGSPHSSFNPVPIHAIGHIIWKAYVLTLVRPSAAAGKVWLRCVTLARLFLRSCLEQILPSFFVTNDQGGFLSGWLCSTFKPYGVGRTVHGSWRSSSNNSNKQRRWLEVIHCPKVKRALHRTKILRDSLP